MSSGINAGVTAFFSYFSANGCISGCKVNLASLGDGGGPGKNTAAAPARQEKVVAIVGESSCGDAASQKHLQ